MAATLSPEMPTSARRFTPPAGSSTVPPRITRSNCWLLCECRTIHRRRESVDDSFLVHYSSIQPVLTSTRTQMGSARRWSIVVLLCLGMVIAYVDRTALSVAIAVPDFRTTSDLRTASEG